MQIRFYKTPRGQQPVKRYIDHLPAEAAASIVAALRDFALYGPQARALTARQIRGKLWEARVGQHRLFYSMLGDDVAVVLHAYKKQTQRAPKGEISIALRRLALLTSS